MNDRAKWLCLLLMVLLAGGGIILAGWMIWERSQKSAGLPLDREQTEELRDQLDHNLKSIFIFDPQTSYRLKPSFRGLRHDSPTLPHVTNSRGILGDAEVNPDPSIRKVLFLGDSVAYGEHIPYEKVFISRMEEAAGPSRQLLNAGCPGWSTHQELEAYRLYLSDLPVDTVAIVFTLNDLLRFEWVWRDESSFQMSAELRGLGGLAHSRLTARSLRELRDRFWNDPGLRPLADLNNTCLNAYLPGRWSRFIEEIRPAVRKIAGEKRLIVIGSPARPQLEALDRGADPETVLFPQRRMERFCAEEGIEFIDLLEVFLPMGKGYDPALFLHDDRGLLHLSQKGHEKVAEYLWPIILKNHMLNNPPVKIFSEGKILQ
ncbi:MAG: SGNH/GDSL hydrolase family protein [PVC group bacterium]